MAAVSNYYQNKMLDNLFRGQAYSAPATTYVALMTAAQTASGGGTEVTGGSYARVALASSLANWSGTQGAGTTAVSSGTSGQISNNNAITFPSPTANWGSIVGFSIYDAATAGNLLWFGALSINKTVNNGDAAPSFNSGNLQLSIS